ncbi:MAG: DUF1553 domain-containing protein, partial [Limisphaerales bacterium]
MFNALWSRAGVGRRAALCALLACCLGGLGLVSLTGCKKKKAKSQQNPATKQEVAKKAAEVPPPKLDGAKSIDEFVLGWLKHLKLQPADPCTDAEFVRRVYVDVLGTLPTAKEASAFISSSEPNKRSALIDRLLERPEFADYWAMKWGDILRIKAEFPVNLWPNAAQAYHHWVRSSIVQNKPYDKFVRELLTSSGSNFRVGPVNFYRALQSKTPESTARTAALTFMGVRADDAWPERSLSGMVACFSQVGYKPTREWKEEIVFWDPDKTSVKTTNAVTPVLNAPPTNKPPAVAAIFPDGTPAKLSPERDPREVFADWLITPKNPWFTRNIANRVWSWLLGRGIIHEPDDIREKNPPSNPDLLAFLEKELVAHRYDLKHLYRLILNSKTYQFSSKAKATGPLAEAHFASYAVRRLDAEVLLDAINKVSGTSDLYTSAIPEPFTFIPKDTPAVALADGSITSPFLALFGRSARATGLESERINRVL